MTSTRWQQRVTSVTLLRDIHAPQTASVLSNKGLWGSVHACNQVILWVTSVKCQSWWTCSRVSFYSLLRKLGFIIRAITEIITYVTSQIHNYSFLHTCRRATALLLCFSPDLISQPCILMNFESFISNPYDGVVLRLYFLSLWNKSSLGNLLLFPDAKRMTSPSSSAARDAVILLRSSRETNLVLTS